MFKNRINKWVGFLFLLAIIVLSDVTVVNAEQKKVQLKQYITISESNYATGNTTLKRSDNYNVGLYVKVFSPQYYASKVAENKNIDSEVFKAIINDASVAAINDGNPWYKANKKFTISLANANTTGNPSNYYALVYSATGDDSKYAYSNVIYQITNVDDSILDSHYVENTVNNSSYCKWAVSTAAKYTGNIFYDNFANVIKKAMSPCFQGNTNYNVSYATLSKLQAKLQELEPIYQAYYVKYRSFYEKNVSPTLPDLDSTWTKVGDTNLTKNGMLTCENKNERTYKYLYYDHEDKYGANIIFGGKTTNKNACTTTCREQLTVSFGPPKVIVAGQCFTYEVEIKSTVTCIATPDLGNFPDFNDYVPCTATPKCNSVAGLEDQAGPEDEFDSCIQEVDGGKYLQSSINKCYTKVYGKKNSTSKKSNSKSSKEVTIGDVKKTFLPVRYQNKDKVLNNVIKVVNYIGDQPVSCPAFGTDAASIRRIYDYANQNITGNYIDLGSTLRYTRKTSCEWDGYGYYYFHNLNRTARSVCNIHKYNYQNNTMACGAYVTLDNVDSCTIGGGCFSGAIKAYKLVCDAAKYGYKTYTDEKGKVHSTQEPNCGLEPYLQYYYVDGEGFVRQQGCGDTCRYIKPATNKDGRACTYYDRETAEREYVSSASNFIQAVIGCISSVANCDQKTETKYTMTANKDIKKDTPSQTCDSSNYSTNKDCLVFPSTNGESRSKVRTFDNLKLTQNAITKFVGGYCANNVIDNENPVTLYHTILTFPGAWINNKNGKIVYDESKLPGGQKKWYTEKKGNYCTPLNAKVVNGSYFEWYQLVKTGCYSGSYEQYAKEVRANKIVYNIFNTVRDFGKYNWNFDTACYYSISDKTTVKKPNGEVCGCDGDSCEGSSSISNFNSKSYTSNNLFPSKTSSSSLKTGEVKKLTYNPLEKNGVVKVAEQKSTRSAGFNWSVNATNLAVPDYPVTPSALVKKIQESKQFDEDEVDYDLTLTKTNIRNIRNLSGKKKEFTSFENGKYVTLENSAKQQYIAAGYNEGDVPVVTFYVSDMFHKTNQYVKVNKKPAESALKCNNIKGLTACDNDLSGFVKTDSELAAFISGAQ